MLFTNQGFRARYATFGAMAGVFAALAACAATPTSTTERSEDDLVGGRQAADDEFPSTLLIGTNCTAAKVGPRHVLTAAHCTDNNPIFREGAALHLTSKKAANNSSTEDPSFIPVVVEKTYIHSTWEEAFGPVKVLGPTLAADVAIVVLTEESAAAIADIPIAEIDTNPVVPGDKLVVMGYGCEEGLYTGFDYANARLKIQSTVALSRDEAITPEREPKPDPNVKIEENYFFTPGAALEPDAAASLCPGDSGGPVYRDDGTQRIIVGVNAYYNFSPGFDSYVSLTNWHTRLDLQSGYGVGDWVHGIVSGGAPELSDAGTDQDAEAEDSDADASSAVDEDASTDGGI